MAPPTIQARPSEPPRLSPTCRRMSVVFLAWRSSSDARRALRDPGAGADGVAEQRQARERHERQRGDDEHHVEIAQEGHRLSGAGV